jgi:hypothetical protein
VITIEVVQSRATLPRTVDALTLAIQMITEQELRESDKGTREWYGFARRRLEELQVKFAAAENEANRK